MNYYTVIFNNYKIDIPINYTSIEVTKLKNNLLNYLDKKIICSDLMLYLIEENEDILLNNTEMINNTNMYLLEIPNHTAISGFSNVLEG